MNSKHPIYQIWKRIKRQCYNSNAKDYIGVEFHQEWRNNFLSFYNSVIDNWSSDLTIVRKNNNLGFIPDNIEFKSKGIISANNGTKSSLKTKGRKLNKETIEKIKSTNVKKYGVEYIFQSKEIQNKIRKNNIAKYGVSNPSTLQTVKNNTKQNNLSKYGVEYPQQLLHNRLNAKKRTIENGQANFYNGQTSDELAKKSSVSRSCINARIRKYGFEQALSMDKRQSEIEHVVENYLKQLNINYYKQIKIGKFIPDFVIEDKKIIIETDGIYWHSDAVNPNCKYHQEKLDEYEKLGYRCLFFRENEINEKIDIVKSMISNVCGLSTKIFARKCIIENINSEESKLFFSNNHLMGKGSGQTIGLKYNNNLVCAMRLINKKDYIDISRFCIIKNHNVVGGFSKLLKYIISIYNKDIHTFIDRRYGRGFYLKDFGFEKINESISFNWVKNNQVIHRLQYKGNSGYKYGFNKLWDCGQAKYILKKALGV